MTRIARENPALAGVEVVRDYGAGRTTLRPPGPRRPPAVRGPPTPRESPPQLIGLFFLFNPSCCSMYDSPSVIHSGAGSPFR